MPVLKSLRNVLFPPPPTDLAIESRSQTQSEHSSSHQLKGKGKATKGDVGGSETTGGLADLRRRIIKGLPPRFYRSALLRRALSGSETPAISVSSEPPTSSAELSTQGSNGPKRPEEDADVIAEAELEAAIRNEGLDWKQLYQTLYRIKTGDVRVSHLATQQEPQQRNLGEIGSGEHTVLGKRKAGEVELELEAKDFYQSESLSSRAGRSALQTTSHLGEKSSLDEAMPDEAEPRRPRTLVQTSPHYIFVADRRSHCLSEAGRDMRVQVYSADTTTKDATENEGREDQQHEHLRPLASIDSTPVLQWITKGTSANTLTDIAITDLRVDAGDPIDGRHSGATPAQRLMVAYNTGHIAVFGLPLPGHGCDAALLAIERLQSFNRTETEDEIVASAFVGEVIVTCSRAFRLSIYHLHEIAEGGIALKLKQTMKSHTCWWPASLSLKRVPIIRSPARDLPEADIAPQRAYKFCIAYCTPSYPSSFTVGLQELLFTVHGDRDITSRFQISSSRHGTALTRFNRTPIDTRGASIFRMRAPKSSREHHRGKPSWASVLPGSLARAGHVSSTSLPSVHAGGEQASSSRILSITFDDPFVVVGSEDNLLEVFELIGSVRVLGSNAHGSASKQPLRLVHRGTVNGHTGSVESVSLEDNRLVSGSKDGSVMVWSLDEEASIPHRPRPKRSREGDRRTARKFSLLSTGQHSSGPSEDAQSARTITAASIISAVQACHVRHVSTLSPSKRSWQASAESMPIVKMIDANADGSLDEDPERPLAAISISNREKHIQEYSLPALALAHLQNGREDDRRQGATVKRPRTDGRSVIRLVSASFDKIVSVFSVGDRPSSEVVQVWSFVS